MSRSVARLMSRLENDSWRAKEGFSEEVDRANQELFKTSTSDEERIKTLNGWLQKYQPCLFGVIAARLGLITYCLLSERDLSESDEFISDRIQSARSQWTASGFDGASSAFIVLAISERITVATPNDNLKKLARKLCS